MKIIAARHARSLGLMHYFTGRPCKNGHVSPRYTNNNGCVKCARDRSEKARANESDRVAAYKRDWYKANKHRLNRSNRKSRAKPVNIIDAHKVISRKDAKRLELSRYYTGKPCKHGHHAERYTSTGCCEECNRIHSKRVRDKMPGIQKKYRERANIARAERRKTDKNYKAMLSMREMLRRALRLAGGKKNSSTVTSLGYSPKELSEHIESLFVKGMSWENHGEWHIDHITPISIMVARGVTDPSVVNALSNLQPLWAADNLSKSAKVK